MAAYVDPNSVHTPTTATAPPAAWGVAVNEAIEYLAGDAASGNPKPMCRVYNSSATSIANSTATALTFDSERFDVGAMHSTSSNTGRITIPTGCGGIYSIGAHVQWASNATGARAVWLRINGTTIIAVDERSPFSGATITQSIVTEYKLAAADYLEVVVQQTSGGSLNLNNASAYSPEFWASWIGVG